MGAFVMVGIAVYVGGVLLAGLLEGLGVEDALLVGVLWPAVVLVAVVIAPVAAFYTLGRRIRIWRTFRRRA